MTIGQWVRRVRFFGEFKRSLTKWHLIDSVVDDEPFTNCGRRLRRKAKSEFETADSMPLSRMIGQPQLCEKCQ